MLKPTIRPFFDSSTGTWTYVVWAEGHEDKRCAIIDSVLGYDIYSSTTRTNTVDCVMECIRSKGLILEWILETHAHADHLTAAHYIKEKMGGKTGISKHILKVIETWSPIFQNGEDTPADGSQFDYLFADNESFSIGPLEVKIIHTPGHTPADTTYIIGDCLFVGDAMFLPDVGSGRCDFPGGSAEDSYASSRKIFTFPDEYKTFVGHDYPPDNRRPPQCMTTIADQKKNNSRFREGISREEFVAKRNQDDQNKAIPQLLLASIQVNLRVGDFGQIMNGIQYIKYPVNHPLFNPPETKELLSCPCEDVL